MDNNVNLDDQNDADGKPSVSLPHRVHAWLSPGHDWVVEIGGKKVIVRLVERRGRRARVALEVQVQRPSLVIRSG